jgi:hypothetical protein
MKNPEVIKRAKKNNSPSINQSINQSINPSILPPLYLLSSEDLAQWIGRGEKPIVHFMGLAL